MDLAVSPCNSWLAAATLDGVVRVWEIDASSGSGVSLARAAGGLGRGGGGGDGRSGDSGDRSGGEGTTHAAAAAANVRRRGRPVAVLTGHERGVMRLQVTTRSDTIRFLRDIAHPSCVYCLLVQS